MTTTERETLVAEVVAANVSCPESVCDWVLDAAERDGIEAGREELRRAIAADEKEVVALTE